ncbi:MAG: hypothetical protein IT423_02150, partial [Pirellulaceae bacterium]|nr:hypothetical protein [Pirellulaceae bacterium]
MLARAFAILVAMTVAMTVWTTAPVATLAADNPIQIENQQPGSTDWQLTRVRLDSGQFRSTWIEG